MTKRAPVIGITCETEPGRPGDYSTYELVVDSRYAAAVREAGGEPVLLPVTDQAAALANIMARIDGLVIVGGEDVDPAFYGAKKHPRTQVIHADRMHFEAALYKAGLRRRLPTFAICYGMQLVNVVEGGTLIQHLTPKGPRKVLHRKKGGHRHDVRIEPKSRLRKLAGTARASVHTSHHQAVDRLAPGWAACALADDGVIEAIEHPAKPQVLAVQWHPERTLENPVTRRLFKAFVRSCRPRP